MGKLQENMCNSRKVLPTLVCDICTESDRTWVSLTILYRLLNKRSSIHFLLSDIHYKANKYINKYIMNNFKNKKNIYKLYYKQYNKNIEVSL